MKRCTELKAKGNSGNSSGGHRGHVPAMGWLGVGTPMAELCQSPRPRFLVAS